MGMFKEWLEYYAVKFGKIVVAVPPHYTSQKCSGCGATVKKSLSVRTHACECGCILDRDENAAINILNQGLSITGYITNTLGRSEIKACGEMTLYLNLETMLEQGRLVKQESPPSMHLRGERQMCQPEVGDAEVCTFKVGSSEVGMTQVDASEVNAAEVNAFEI